MLREKGNVRGQIQIYVLLLMNFSWCILSAQSDGRINGFNKVISRVDTMSTLNSFSKIGQFYKMDYQGDYDAILQYMNLIFTGGAASTFSEFDCSLFSATGDEERMFYGRNFDNPECDVLLGRYQSPGKHRSLAMTRICDLGFPLGTDYSNLTFHQKKKLLNAPYLLSDGINECGVTAGLAYVPSVTFIPDPAKQSIFVTYLLRKIMDEADNSQEALTIANSYNVFDGGNELNIISHHVLVSDSLGNSAILEFADGQWQYITTSDNWQVLTNSPIYNVPVNTLLNQCWRYNFLYNSLLVENGALTDWRQAMDILELATWEQGTSGTEWSTISDLNHNYLYVSIDNNFENIVRADLDSFEFKNFGDINVASYDIQDENGNGTLEQGEDIIMVLNLTADFDTPGLTVTLSSDQPGINVINPVQVYGDLEAQYELSNYENPFVIELTGSQIPTLLSLTLDYQTNYGYTGSKTFDVSLTALGNDNSVGISQPVNLNCYPNPLKSNTNISFEIKQTENAQIEVFNLKGQKVASFDKQEYRPGKHQIFWYAKDQNNETLASGVYFVRLKSDNVTATKKVLLLK